MNSKSVAGDGGDGGGGEGHILIRHELASGTNGGSLVAGSWQTRALNTIVYDTGGHASIASNQITLDAGTYRFEAEAVAYRVNAHKLKLVNITDTDDLGIGLNYWSAANSEGYNAAIVKGRFTIADTKVLELQHRSSATKTTNGFGVANGFGVIEVYASIEFWREA